MIVGVDHLTFGVNDLCAGVRVIEALGFERAFTLEGVANDESKKPYLQRWQPEHDISLLRPRDEGVAVELVKHSDCAAGAWVARAAVLLTGRVPEAMTGAWSYRGRLAVAEAFELESPERAVPCELGSAYGPALWLTGTSEDNRESASIVGVALLVRDLQVSLEFWTGQLNLRRHDQSSTGSACRWATLEMSSPVPAWRLLVALIEDSEVTEVPATLDARGLTSVCFISTDVRTDAPLLAQYPGAGFGRPFRIDIAGRILVVSVGHGPQGEMIELIQVETP